MNKKPLHILRKKHSTSFDVFRHMQKNQGHLPLLPNYNLRKSKEYQNTRKSTSLVKGQDIVAHPIWNIPFVINKVSYIHFPLKTQTFALTLTKFSKLTIYFFILALFALL